MTDAAAPITACLLHADYHRMAADCWGVVIDWQEKHQHLPERQRRDAYQAAVERRALDTIRIGNAVNHAIPPAVDRAVRRDHSLCGTEPCSDCR